MAKSPGNQLRQAVQSTQPLAVLGTINAYSALLAEHAGAKALYLSGAGVANASYGLPDLGVTTFSDVCEDIRRITAVTEVPLLVDADTGWGHLYVVQRAIQEIEKAGAAGVHIEDQVQAKRCGHRPNKQIVSQQEMVDRVKAAVDARANDDFVVMARTDALANEGLDSALERAAACVAAGADMVFPEAVQELSQYKAFAEACGVPILANITEFGKTPLFTREQLASADVGLALYPLSAFRAMSKAALDVYQTILNEGTQESMLEHMQTRAELYEHLAYHEFEKKLDTLLS